MQTITGVIGKLLSIKIGANVMLTVDVDIQDLLIDAKQKIFKKFGRFSDE